MGIRPKRALKIAIQAAASKALRLAGVNGLVAGVASHLFWRFIVVPIIKHAHKKGRLKVTKSSIVVQKHDKSWHNLNHGLEQKSWNDLKHGME